MEPRGENLNRVKLLDEIVHDGTQTPDELLLLQLPRSPISKYIYQFVFDVTIL